MNIQTFGAFEKAVVGLTIVMLASLFLFVVSNLMIAWWLGIFSTIALIIVGIIGVILYFNEGKEPSISDKETNKENTQ